MCDAEEDFLDRLAQRKVQAERLNRGWSDDLESEAGKIAKECEAALLLCNKEQAEMFRQHSSHLIMHKKPSNLWRFIRRVAQKQRGTVRKKLFASAREWHRIYERNPLVRWGDAILEIEIRFR